MSVGRRDAQYPSHPGKPYYYLTPRLPDHLVEEHIEGIEREEGERPPVLAIRNFRQVGVNDDFVTFDGEPTEATHRVWVYMVTLRKGDGIVDPWPRAGSFVRPVRVPADEVFPFQVPVPDVGEITFVQFEPRDASGPVPRAGQVERATVSGLPGVLPSISFVYQEPATTPGPARTNLGAAISDPLGRPGRLYASLNYGSPESPPAPETVLQADGYTDLAGPRAVTQADVWQLTGSGTAHLFRDLTVHAQLGKRIFLRYVTIDGADTGWIDHLVQTWHQIIVGATGEWVEEVVSGAAIRQKEIGQHHLDISELSMISENVGILKQGILTNAAGTHYLNLGATGSQPFLVTPKLTVYNDGNANFGGVLTSEATVTGRIIVAGNLGNGAVDVSTVIGDGVVTAPKLQIAELSDIKRADGSSVSLGIIVRGALRDPENRGGIQISPGYSFNPSVEWQRGLDLTATGTWPFLWNQNVLIRADGLINLGQGKVVIQPNGDASFGGVLSASSQRVDGNFFFESATQLAPSRGINWSNPWLGTAASLRSEGVSILITTAPQGGLFVNGKRVLTEP